MAGPASRPILCIDVGGTSTKLGLFTHRPPVQMLDTIASVGPVESFAEALCRSISRSLESNNLHTSSLLGLGVAVAGFLNDDRDRMIYNSNLPWLEGYPLRDRLTRQFHTRVAMEIDSNAAALAEQRYGVGSDSSRFLCIAVGTGLGVGMIVNGEPLRFAYGCMGDPGHVIVQRNGPACTCGGHGCAESFVSAPVLAEQYRAARGLDSQISLRDVINAAREGDEAATAVLNTAGTWLGVATASFANIFFPDLIAFAGGLAEAGDLVLASLRESFEISASVFARAQVTLTRAILGATATLTGAACTVAGCDDAR
jgi:glucokinase